MSKKEVGRGDIFVHSQRNVGNKQVFLLLAWLLKLSKLTKGKKDAQLRWLKASTASKLSECFVLEHLSTK